MGAKLKIALCALLLINLGSTALEGPLGVGNSEAPEPPPSPSSSETPQSMPDSGLVSPRPAAELTLQGSNSSMNSNTSTADETTVGPQIPQLTSTADVRDKNEGNGDNPASPPPTAEGPLGVGNSEAPEPPSSPSSSETPQSMPDSGLVSPRPAAELTLQGSNSSMSSNTSTADETTVGPQIPQLTSTPDVRDKNEGNATSTDPTIVSPSPEKEGNLTDHLPSLPPVGPGTPTSHPTTITASPTHTAHATPAQTPVTTPHSDTTRHSTSPHTSPHSTSPSSRPTSPSHPETHSPTSAPAPEPRHTEPGTTIAAGAGTQASSTSSSISDPQPPQLPSSKPTSESRPHPETSSAPRTESPVTPPSTPSASAKSPSALNVGGDATVVHESSTLDPLLAGLVSAFIITAVIITLLLFLKLRRRNNRPEFRRLQDLPMDDMMEDTPLSMYSY